MPPELMQIEVGIRVRGWWICPAVLRPMRWLRLPKRLRLRVLELLLPRMRIEMSIGGHWFEVLNGSSMVRIDWTDLSVVVGESPYSVREVRNG